MKTNLHLAIPNPCSEKWGNFMHSTASGFCSSCSKVVFDFTKMNDDEILELLSKKPSHTCGRFRPVQLKTYSERTILKISPTLTLLKAGFLSLLFILVSEQTFSQTVDTKSKKETVQSTDRSLKEKNSSISAQIIKGVVKSGDDGSLFPGVNIHQKNSEEGTVTDVNGQFTFPDNLKEGDVLLFSFIGFETQEYIVPQKTNEPIQIQMTLNVEQLMGAVAVTEVYTPKSGFSRMWSKIKNLF